MNMKKRAALAVAAFILIIAGTAAALSYLALIRPTEKPPPEPFIEAVIGEPDYQIALKWNAIDFAEEYCLEYRYSYFPDRLGTVYPKTNSYSVARINGTLSVRIAAIYKTGERGAFSEWKDYMIEPIGLAAPEPFVFIKNGSAYMIPDDFHPVAYTYKGFSGAILFYRIVIVGPGSDPDAEFAKTPTYVIWNGKIEDRFNFYPGEWKFYIQAVNYKVVNDVGAQFTAGEARYELYLYYGPSDWTEVVVNVYN
jgi:hypothetical protein